VDKILQSLNNTAAHLPVRRRTNSSQNSREAAAEEEPMRFKPVGFNVRDDGEGLANSGNKLAHVINLAMFNEREEPKAVTLSL
jgi:hypothetical protein